jgi:hypothetical protein
MENWRRLIPYIFVLALWVITVVTKYSYHGLVFGFDYGLYQPDGKYYTYMTLDLINHNSIESAQQVVNWYASNSFKGNIFNTSDLIPETSPIYSYISHRILYPLLSLPFVYFFGIPGMIAVPALSFLLLLYVILKVSSIYNFTYVGVIICFILSISPTVTRWMVINTTDALLVGLFSYSVILLNNLKSNAKIACIQLFPLIILTAATRFSLVFWVAIGLVLFINSKKILAIWILFIAFICAIPALNATLGVSLLPNSKEQSTLEKIFSLPISFCKVLFIDIAQLVVLDRALLAFLIIGVTLAIFQIRNVASQYFIAVLLAGYFLGAINGTLGVNFRYQMSAIPFCAWAIISSLSLVSGKPNLFSLLRPHIKT